MSKGQKIAMWVVSGLLTALFLFAGLPKLLTPAKMLSQWVYAPWFLTFVGVCETLGAIGLMIPHVQNGWKAIALSAGARQELFVSTPWGRDELIAAFVKAGALCE